MKKPTIIILPNPHPVSEESLGLTSFFKSPSITWAALLILVSVGIPGCRENEQPTIKQEVRFSINSISASGSSGGRVQSFVPASVMVTIRDVNGKLVAEQQKLSLYKFNDTFLSIPLTLNATAPGYFYVTDFFVLDQNDNVGYATPREGSKYAHLVSDPLDIKFSVTNNVITTVTPEVLSINDTSPSDFGYGQFGFNEIRKIEVVFSSFIKGSANFELTGSHLKVEGLTTATSTDAVWSYETELLAKANIVALKEAAYYRITATKGGYKTWQKVLQLQNEDALEIIFDQKLPQFDVYVAGVENSKATYWKNGIAVKLSDVYASSSQSISVSNGDVYVAGWETFNSTTQAIYWKNSEKVTLSEYGSTFKILAKDNDVYIIGDVFTSKYGTAPAYWKNGVLTSLVGTGKYPSVTAYDLAVDGEDVYICGQEGNIGTTNKEDSYPILWKNGKLIELPVPSISYKRTFALSTKVENGHVYVAGNTTDPTTGIDHGLYWKDGEVVGLLGVETKGTFANNMAIENDKVHIVGWQNESQYNHLPQYWIDGTQMGMQPLSTSYDRVIDIKVVDGHAAITGHDDGRAAYWLDGERFYLSAKPLSTMYTSTGISVSVVKK